MVNLLFTLAIAATVDVRIQPEHLEQGQVGLAIVRVYPGLGERLDAGAMEVEFSLDEGASVERMGPPNLPMIPMNGRLVRLVEFQYLLTAESIGRWSIGPATITMDGKKTVSDTEELIVTAHTTSDDDGWDDIEVEASFNQEQAWEGQVVRYSHRSRVLKDVSRETWRLPDFYGLRTPAGVSEIQQRYQILDGDQKFTISESVTPMVVTGTGDLTAPAAVAEFWVNTGRVGFMGMNETRREHRNTKKATLKAKKLPKPPKDFSGVIGDFRVDALLDAKEAKVGDELVLRFAMFGDGLTEGFQLRPPVIEGASVYEDERAARAQMRKGEFVGEAVVIYTVVPNRPGELVIPPLSLVTFSPTKGQYQTLTVTVPSVKVTGDEQVGVGQSFADEATELENPEATLLSTSTWGVSRAPHLATAVMIVGGGLALPGGVVVAGAGLVNLYRRRPRREVVIDERKEARRKLKALEQKDWDGFASLVAVVEGSSPDGLEALTARLGRVRFADAVDEELDADLREFLVKALEGT